MSPGSTPRIITRITPRRAGHHLVGSGPVGVDVLHIVEVIEVVNELGHLAGIVEAQLDLVLRLHDLVGGIVVEAGVLQSLAHGEQVGRTGHNGEHLTVIGNVLGTGFGGGFEQLVEVHALGRHRDLALALEVEGHGAGGGQGAVALGQGGTDFGGRTVAVVGKAFDDEANAGRSVALVDDVFVVGGAVFSTGTTLDGTSDVVGRHGGLLGLVDGIVQGRVAVRVATAEAGGDFDVLDELGEELAALGVDGGLLVLGGRPLGMT